MSRGDAKLRAAELWSSLDPGRTGTAIYRKSGLLRYEVGFFPRGSSKFTTLGRGATWELAFDDADRRERTDGTPA